MDVESQVRREQTVGTMKHEVTYRNCDWLLLEGLLHSHRDAIVCVCVCVCLCVREGNEKDAQVTPLARKES